MLAKMKDWALEVGELQRDYFRSTYKVSNKKEKINLVTEVDQKSEKILLNKIRNNFPADKILAEESGNITGDSLETGRWWIIDPLDGTVNYVHGFHIFGISLAFLIDGKLDKAVVYIPMLEEMYEAQRQGGSFINGEKMELKDNKDLSRAVIATGFPYDHQSNSQDIIDMFSQVLPLVGGIRRTGSAAFDLCQVARGVFDGFWEVRLSPWDIAAGALIISEAGGVVTNFSGEEIQYNAAEIVAGNRFINQELRQVLEGE